jgi:hypothetical protein
MPGLGVLEVDGEGKPTSAVLVIGFDENAENYAQLTFEADNAQTLNATTIEAYYGGAEVPVFPSSTAAMTPATQSICTQCAFMNWGSWTANVSWGAGTAAAFASGDGYWIAARPIEPPDLPEQGTASYNGTAVGRVLGDNGFAEARGTIEMGWNFANRSGDFSINDFDAQRTGGINVSGPISGADSVFAGALTGEGHSGTVLGSFAAGPSNLDQSGLPLPGTPPEGVAGQFTIGSDDGSYIAQGIFGGAINH